MIGAQLPQPDPRGILVFEHLPTDLQRAEDSRLDADRTHHHQTRTPSWNRPATDTERTLLTHLGYTMPTTELRCTVSFPAAGIRRRTFPNATPSKEQP